MKLNAIQEMGYDEFALRSKMNMPSRLYKYYPDVASNEKTTGETVNYSLQALENNTVFLQTPTEFDDVYDSDIHIDYLEYEHLRLTEYCHRCGLNIDANQSTQDIGNLENVFTQIHNSKIQELSNKWFVLAVINELYKTFDFGKATASVLQIEYRDYISI